MPCADCLCGKISGCPGCVQFLLSQQRKRPSTLHIVHLCKQSLVQCRGTVQVWFPFPIHWALHHINDGHRFQVENWHKQLLDPDGVGLAARCLEPTQYLLILWFLADQFQVVESKALTQLALPDSPNIFQGAPERRCHLLVQLPQLPFVKKNATRLHRTDEANIARYPEAVDVPCA